MKRRTIYPDTINDSRVLASNRKLSIAPYLRGQPHMLTYSGASNFSHSRMHDQVRKYAPASGGAPGTGNETYYTPWMCHGVGSRSSS